MNSLDTFMNELEINAMVNYHSIYGNNKKTDKANRIDGFLWLNPNTDFKGDCFNDFRFTLEQEEYLKKKGVKKFCKRLDAEGIEYNKHPRGYLHHFKETEYFLMSNRRINMKIRDTIVRKFPIEEAILKLDEIKQPYKLEKDYDVDII